jgi:hypothetical protein
MLVGEGEYVALRSLEDLVGAEVSSFRKRHAVSREVLLPGGDCRRSRPQVQAPAANGHSSTNSRSRPKPSCTRPTAFRLAASTTVADDLGPGPGRCTVRLITAASFPGRPAKAT